MLRSINSILVVVILLISIYLKNTLSSSGDQEYKYYFCIKTCLNSICKNRPIQINYMNIWSCEDNCQYNCMRNITNEYIYNGNHIHKYYGHWPFIRILGYIF